MQVTNLGRRIVGIRTFSRYRKYYKVVNHLLRNECVVCINILQQSSPHEICSGVEFGASSISLPRSRQMIEVLLLDNFFMKLTLLGLTFVCLSLKSKSLSFYIGLETTLAVVCKTHNGVKALETFGMQGLMNKRSCFYGAEASIGRPLDH